MDRLRLINILLLSTLTACSESDNTSIDEPTSFVFTSRDAIQCVSRGIDPEENALELISSGIDVLSTTCGYQTDVDTQYVCLSGTAEFITHQIREVNLPDAVKIGFANIENLEGEYELQECITTPVELIVPECGDFDGDGICDIYDENPLDPTES